MPTSLIAHMIFKAQRNLRKAVLQRVVNVVHRISKGTKLGRTQIVKVKLGNVAFNAIDLEAHLCLLTVGVAI